MKAAFTFATVLFWLAVIGLALPLAQAPPPATETRTGAAAITLAVVARHGTADDCWMAIDGVVYDLSPYVERHPTEPEVIAKHCGTDASRAFADKDVGRPHSARAQRLLEDYRLARLER